MTKDLIKEKIKEIILSLDLGYTFQMSDYASSKAQEDEYEAAGLKEVDEKADQLLALFEQEWEEREKGFEYEHLERQEDVRKHIQQCEGRHTQQAIYSTFHDGLTQVCFGCRIVRSTL